MNARPHNVRMERRSPLKEILMLATLLLTIIAHFLATEHRLTQVEQKVDNIERIVTSMK